MHQKRSSFAIRTVDNALRGRKRIIFTAIQQALCYSDIFLYPLTGDQLFRFLPTAVTRKDFLSVLPYVPHRIVGNTLYYFLPHKVHIVAERIKREKISAKKLIAVRKIVRVLSHIPTITFIGISGSLAVKNTESTGDSDLFFITRHNTLWISRLLVYLVLFLFGVKRTKRKKGSSICANMFMDEEVLQFSVKKRNIYIAHEVAQLVPLYNKHKAYERFLLANVWVTKYFPNMIFPKRVQKHSAWPFSLFLFPIEVFVGLLQRLYMQGKQTREIASATRIAFHPIDYESQILSKYDIKKRRYGV